MRVLDEMSVSTEDAVNDGGNLLCVWRRPECLRTHGNS